mmetsp:Transcript_3675/g.9103  ORF Transcript_3675/g.9103 Transcript_3675/m.9103 type:complete len:693 (-) Transcript_3675:10-2088(-)
MSGGSDRNSTSSVSKDSDEMGMERDLSFLTMRPVLLEEFPSVEPQGMVTPHSMKEGRTSARHFKSPDSGLPKFGGTTSTEMYQSWKRLEKQQGKIVISDAGIVREGGFGNAMERERILEAVRFKLDYFFANNMADARNIFRKLDASGNCLLTRIEFEKAIKAMHVGFSMVQMKVLLDFVFENLSKDQSMGLEKLVNYVEFMNEFSPKSTSGLKVSRGRRGGRKKIVLDPAPEVEIDEEFIDEEKVDSAPFIILLTGFFVCPVWLFGINYVNSKKTSERLSAKLSLFLALAVFIIVVVVSTYYTNPGKGKENPQHCKAIEGVLVAFRFVGFRAKRSTFYDPTVSSGYNNVILFKDVLHSLYIKTQIAITYNTNDGILVDAIQDIPQDADGATLLAIVRIVVTDINDAQTIENAIPEWIRRGSLRTALASQNLDFERILIGSVPVSGSENQISTPVYFKQTDFIYVPGAENGTVVSSIPFLMRQPPTTSNPLNPQDSGWAVYNNSRLPTCWFVEGFELPANPCLSNATSAACSTGQSILSTKRKVNFILQSESSDDLLQIWVRQTFTPITVVDTPPMPTWLMDTTNSYGGKAFRDTNRCSNPELLDTCKWNYEVTIYKGPYKSYFWVGVVGKREASQFVPFKIFSQYEQTDNSAFSGNPNPFLQYLTGETSAASSRHLNILVLLFALHVCMSLV